MVEDLGRIVVITGHYGTGKTTLAVNLAADFAAQGESVTLVDMDTVNPYFRSADFQQVAEEYGFTLLAPPYANTNLDMPVLTAAVDASIAGTHRLVMDVGGDGDGAIALGRYAAQIMRQDYTMLYVINRFRYLTQQPEQAVEYLRSIEAAARISVDYIVNNPNLSGETTWKHIEQSLPFAQKVAEIAEIPLLATTANKALLSPKSAKQDTVLENVPYFYPLSMYRTSPWDEHSQL